jgi:hypothetical protein
MSDDPRFDVAYEAIVNSSSAAPEAAALLAREVVDALRAYDAVHSSDKSLGVRRWDVMAHESRLRQQFERELRALPYEGIENMGAVISRRSALDIVKGPIGG